MNGQPRFVPPSPAPSFRNLKVGGLPPEVTDTDLRSLFEKYGKVESAKVMLNVETCESRGYGFVLFDSQEAGCRAFGERNKQIVSSGTVTFQLDIKPSDWDGKHGAAETNAIYVRNIPCASTDEMIRSYFEQVGEVTNVTSRAQTTRNDSTSDGTPQKQAMIEFSSISTARAAIEHAHRKCIFPGAKTPVLAKFADLPEVKHNKRQQKIAASPGNGSFSTNLGHSFPQHTPPTGFLPPPPQGGVRYPDARPLPLVPRPGYQRVFFQGILGITPDGILYPIQPELCHYVSSHAGPQQAQMHPVSHTPPAWHSAGGPFIVATPQQLVFSQQVGTEGLFFVQPVDQVET